MIRTLTFQGTPEHRIYFRLLYEAFRSRGSAAQDARVSKEDKRSDAKLLRALKSVSDPVGEAPPDGELDARLRALKPEGGILALEQPEFKRLQTYCDTTQWMSAVTDVAADLDDWLDSAEKVDAT